MVAVLVNVVGERKYVCRANLDAQSACFAPFINENHFSLYSCCHFNSFQPHVSLGKVAFQGQGGIFDMTKQIFTIYSGGTSEQFFLHSGD